MIPLVLGEAAVTESLTSDRDGATTSSTDAVGVRISTIGVNEFDAAEVIATWTIPSSVFADYGPAPEVSVYFDTAVSATLATDNWSGNSASLFITASGTLGASEVGQGDSVLAQIGRGDSARLVAEEHSAGFGSQVELGGAGAALVVEFRVSCFVASSDNPFGFGAESSCDVSAVEFQEARITVRPSDDG